MASQFSESLIQLVEERIESRVGGAQGDDPDRLPIAAPGVMGTVVDRATAAPTLIAKDAFTRSVTDAWGDTETGLKTWVAVGGAPSDYSATGTRGRMSLGSTASRNMIFDPTATDLRNVDITTTFVAPATALGDNINYSQVARWIDGSNHYELRIEYKTTGNANLRLLKRIANVSTELALATDQVSYTPGTLHSVRFRLVEGRLRGKAWLASAAEPLGWAVSSSDSALTSGTVGLRAIINSLNTNPLPVIADFDDFAVSMLYPDQHLITVLVDGGAGEVEALCFSDVRARPGDRVGLQKFGAHWVAVGTFGRPGHGAAQHFPAYGWDSTEFGSTNSTNVNTFAVMPGAPTATFVKEHDYTGVAIELSAQLYCTVAVTTATRLGARFTNAATGQTADLSVVGFNFRTLDNLHNIGGQTVFDFGGLPAGTYTVSLLWRRAGGGTGTINTDALGWSSMRVQETVVAYSVTS